MLPNVSIDHRDGSDYSNETSSENYNDSFGPFSDEEGNAIERFPHEEDNSDDEVYNPTVVGSQWNVGHEGGDYRYNDAAQPELDRLRIKWIPRSAVEFSDHIRTELFLDSLSIIGLPGEAISKLDYPLLKCLFRTGLNHMAYAAKHSLGIKFKLTGRTFRLAKTENRDTWFIAMYPKPSVTCEDSRPHHNLTQGLAADSGMLKERATCLAAYITDTFKDPMLIGHWVEPKLEWETYEPPPGAEEDSSEDKNSEYSDEDVSMEYHEEILDSDEDVDMDDSTSSQRQTNRLRFPSHASPDLKRGAESFRPCQGVAEPFLADGGRTQ
ncbi:hypothetical protein E4U52_005963 [Claviceps spartinae]|nr:hypothetical protein E4U52_005963 [Claviceps spartinae]